MEYRFEREPSYNRNKILIIEDEELIRDELSVLLENAGFATECVCVFENTLQQVKDSDPDLILLDVNLPGMDGFWLCAQIRSFSRTPILFLNGRNTAMDELQALTLGGDDYVSKPFNVPVLLARIRLLLKRSSASSRQNRLEYRGISLDLAAGTLDFSGRRLELTKTELKIMYYLFSHAGEIVPRLDLVEYLWDNEIHIDDNTLSVNVMRIREKLRAIGINELIQTKRGMGYKI